MGQKQVIDIPLAGGLRQKTAEPYLDGTSQVTAQNAIWVKQNAVEKRPGWIALTNAVRTMSLPWLPTSLAQAQGLYPNGSDIAVTDGTFLYARSQSASDFAFVDFVPPCVGTRKVVATSMNGVLNPDVAEIAGVRCFVWEDGQTPNANGSGNAIMYALLNVVTGDVFSAGVVDRNTFGYQPKVITRTTISGPLFSVFWVPGNASASKHNIYVATIQAAATGAWGLTQTITTDFDNGNDPGCGWDVAACIGVGGDTTHAMLCYESTAASPNLRCLQLTIAGLTWSAGASSVVSPESATHFSAVGARWVSTLTGSVLWVAYAYAPSGGNTLVRAQAISLTPGGSVFTSLFNPVTLYTTATSTANSHIIGVGIDDLDPNFSGTVVIAWGATETIPNPGIGWCTLTSVGVATTATGTPNLQLLSRPFALASADTSSIPYRVYAMVADTTSQPTQMLVELDVQGGLEQSPRPCASVAPRLALATTGSPGNTATIRGTTTLSSVNVVGSKSPAPVVIAGTITQTSNVPSLLSLLSATFDFTSPARFLSVSLGGLTYVGGGIPGTFDGINMAEISTLYPMAPDASSALTGSGTGGGLANGQTYTYVFVPEWRDNAGNVHQGQPSAPVQVAIPGSTSFLGSVSGRLLNIQVTQQGLEWRSALFGQSTLYLVPYRSVFLNGAMSTNLFRLVGDDPGPAYANLPGILDISFSDAASDASIASNELLPTTGGTLENDAPSSFSGICAHQSRVYGIGDDLRTIWISTVQQDGVPCTFSDGSQTEVSFLGDLTAIWSMDDKLFIASATGIAYMTGSGPNAQGIQSDLSPAEQIPSDVGVTDPRAVCVTPIGTVFAHRFGIGLLDRSLSVQSGWGDPIESVLATGSVTGIQLHPTRPEILVFVNGGAGIGTVAAYNYRFGSWSTWSILDHISGGNNQLSANATLVVGGEAYAALGDGLVAREKIATDASQFFDSVSSSPVTDWVTLKIVTGWVKPGGSIQGWGRLMQADSLFQPLDWADLQLRFAYDYLDLAISQPYTFTSTQISAFPEVDGLLTSTTTTRVSVRPFQARCESFQLVISDAQPGGSPAATTGRGFRIFGLTVSVENKGGIHRVPAGQRT